MVLHASLVWILGWKERHELGLMLLGHPWSMDGNMLSVTWHVLSVEAFCKFERFVNLKACVLL